MVTRAVALIVAPPGSSIPEMDDLKGKTIGVVEVKSIKTSSRH